MAPSTNILFPLICWARGYLARQETMLVGRQNLGTKCPISGLLDDFLAFDSLFYLNWLFCFSV